MSNLVIIIFASAFSLVFLLLLGRSLFFLVQVRGRSMYPALDHGDLLLVIRALPGFQLRNGQIVVSKLPVDLHSLCTSVEEDTPPLLIKRVAALAGEISIIPVDQNCPILQDCFRDVKTDEINRISRQVPHGHCILKGDSPGLDSTQLGPIPLGCILGIVLVRIWHRKYGFQNR